MATSARSTALRDRDRQTASDTLLDRLREQFPELGAADLAEAVVGVLPLPELDAPTAEVQPGPVVPRYRA